MTSPSPKPEPGLESPALLDWISEGPCLVCALRAIGVVPNGCDPHHVQPKGMGGTAVGDIDNVVGLCRAHHDELGRLGPRRFEVKYRVNLARWAVTLTAEWRQIQPILDSLPFREEVRHAPRREPR